MSLEIIAEYLAEAEPDRRAELVRTLRSRLWGDEREYLPPTAEIRDLCSRPVKIQSSVGGWKTLACRMSAEEMVPMGPFAGYLNPSSFCAAVNAIYFQEDPEYRNFVGEPIDRRCSLLTHFARRDVAERLSKGAGLLRRAGMFFELFDTYRPLSVQKALFETFKKSLSRERRIQSAEELEAETQRYISKPAPDPIHGNTHASPHSTGAAVDLSIVRLPIGALRIIEEISQSARDVSFSLPQYYIDGIKNRLAGENAGDGGNLVQTFEANWQPRLFGELASQAVLRIFGAELDMGTVFDFFGEEAASDFFEKQGGPPEVTANRRLLYNLLHDLGFQNYEEEWWHYSRGDNMAARKLGLEQSEYFGCELTAELRAFERIRRAIWETFPPVPLTPPRTGPTIC